MFNWDILNAYIFKYRLSVSQFSFYWFCIIKKTASQMHVAPRIVVHCCPSTFSIYYLGSLDLEGPFYSIYISMQPKAAPVKRKSRNNCHIYESQISLFHFYPSSTGDCGRIWEGDRRFFGPFHHYFGGWRMEGQCNSRKMPKEALKIKFAFEEQIIKLHFKRIWDNVKTQEGWF